MNARSITRILVALWFMLLGLWAARAFALDVRREVTLLVGAACVVLLGGALLARLAARERGRVAEAALEGLASLGGESFRVVESGGPRSPRAMSCGVLLVTESEVRYVYA